MGVACIPLADTYPAINWANTSELTGCHTPLIIDYFSTNKVQCCAWGYHIYRDSTKKKIETSDSVIACIGKTCSARILQWNKQPEGMM